MYTIDGGVGSAQSPFYVGNITSVGTSDRTVTTFQQMYQKESSAHGSYKDNDWVGEIQNQYGDINFNGISDIWDYYHTYLSSFKQIQSTQAAVEANQEAYDATKASYDNGVSSITDLLNAQSRLSQARQQFVLAESTLASSIARLAHATGALLANTEAQPDLPAIPAPQPDAD